MSPGDIDTILRRLDKQDLDMTELRRDVREIKADGKETKAEVKRTNGRVTSIEGDRAVEKAVREQHEAERQEDLTDFREKMARQAGMRTAAAGAAIGTIGLFFAYLLQELVRTGHL